MSETYDVIIVGGGIVGCACAHYIARAGLKCAVVESGPIGGGTTAAGMGHVVVMDDSDAQFNLTQYSQHLWAELEDVAPRCEVTPTGTLWVAADDEEASFLPGKAEFYRSRGVPVEILTADEVERAEPGLRKGLAGGLQVPRDSVVYPITAARWLLEQAESKGTKWISDKAASITGTSVTLRSGKVLTAGNVINAAGSRAPELTPGIPIEPRKGHLVITDRYPDAVNHQIVEMGYLKSAHASTGDSVAFNVQPRATGQLLIGSSRQFVGWDGSVDSRIVSKMLRRALEFMPGLASMSAIRTWTGFRAATPDKLPFIGPWNETPNLYIAAGHEGLGITTSLATGQLMADLLTGTTPKLDPTPFRCDRSMEKHA